MFLYLLFSFSLCNKAKICVCREKLLDEGGCKKLCGDIPKCGFSQSSIENAMSSVTQDEWINFYVAGTDSEDPDYQPEFNLDTLSKRSFSIIPMTKKRETIQVKPGHVETGSTHSFENINIYLDQPGVYDFYKLILRESTVHSKTPNLVELEQDVLDIDYESLHNISPQIDFSPPTHGIDLHCNASVNKVEFWPTHQLFFMINDSEGAQLDFSQVERQAKSVVHLSARRINFTFHSLPDSLDYFPEITFSLLKTARIYIDEEQFDDEVMDLTEKIVINHGNKGVYIDSRKDTFAPTFGHIGSGPFFSNNEPVDYYTSYCLCDGEECKSLCTEESKHIVTFANIDRTVIGNPNKVLKYYIAGTSKSSKPIFDLEHFGNRNLTVIGVDANQHIQITGDATDDVGFHDFEKIQIHSKKDFLFPYTTLTDVKFTYDGEDSEFKPVLNSTRLFIDFDTLKRLKDASIQLIAPLYGLSVDTRKYVKGDITVKLISKTAVSIKGIQVPYRNHTTLEIYTTETVDLDIDEEFPKKVSYIPKLTIHAQSDSNHINFIGKWPEELNHLTAKILIIHNENPLYVTGDYDGKQYKFDPPLIAHEGDGAFFSNGQLKNFKSRYCICEGDDCDTICKDVGPKVDYKEDSILKTADGNPTRLIEYVIFNTDSKHMPYFGLHDYIERGFMIYSTTSNKQYIEMEGAKDHIETVSSVSYIFKNIHIVLDNPGYYTFNNAELDDCEFSRKQTSDDGRNHEFYLYQNGMTIDMSTLISLDSEQLLSPCSLYLVVNGEQDLNKISIDNPTSITLYSKDGKSVNIDTSELTETSPTFTTHLAGNEKEPFVVEWNGDSTIFNHELIPPMRIDVSGTKGEDAYVEFTGRKWTHDFHNITDKITVVHGQLDIHIMTHQNENGKFEGQPPHVSLVGFADYYINDVRQVSVFSTGNHEFNENDDEDSFLITKIVGGIIFGCLIVFAIFQYRKSSRINHDGMPVMRIAPQNDNEEDDQLSNFLNTVDEENPNDK